MKNKKFFYSIYSLMLVFWVGVLVNSFYAMKVSRDFFSFSDYEVQSKLSFYHPYILFMEKLPRLLWLLGYNKANDPAVMGEATAQTIIILPTLSLIFVLFTIGIIIFGIFRIKKSENKFVNWFRKCFKFFYWSISLFLIICYFTLVFFIPTSYENAVKFFNRIKLPVYSQKYSNQNIDLKKFSQNIKDGNNTEYILLKPGSFKMGKRKIDSIKDDLQKEVEEMKSKMSNKNEKKSEVEKQLLAFVESIKLMVGEDNKKQIDILHEVEITRPVYFGKYEVTREQWYRIMKTKPWEIEENSISNNMMMPVTNVSWENVLEFLEKLNENSKNYYRLPTEAEWEYACRAGSETKYYFGDNEKELNKYGNFLSAKNKTNNLSIVGKYLPNKYGLYDMHGNAAEWCLDVFDDEYYYNSPQKDPVSREEKINRRIISFVIRGGSFKSGSMECASYFRNSMYNFNKAEGVGFRLVMEINQNN